MTSPAEMAGRCPPTPRTRHTGLILVVGAALVLLVVVLSLGVGSHHLGPGEVVRALAGNPDEAFHTHIVIGLRLPRALIATASGAMLSVAGSLLQSATRNVLADPGLLGVTGGAVISIVAVTVVAGAVPTFVLGLSGLLGALLAGGFVYLMSWRADVGPTRLVLDGLLVAATLSSIVSVMLLMNGDLLGVVLRWTIGSVHGRVWSHWAMLWPWAAISIPFALACRRAASGLWMGDNIASSTGLRPRRARLVVCAAAVALSAGAVTAVGAIAFVGLLGPHLARLLVGTHPTRVIPAAAVVGALLLVGADVIAELLSTVIPAGDIGNRAAIPAGAVTALVGGPTLVWLLSRRDRAW